MGWNHEPVWYLQWIVAICFAINQTEFWRINIKHTLNFIILHEHELQRQVNDKFHKTYNSNFQIWLWFKNTFFSLFHPFFLRSKGTIIATSFYGFFVSSSVPGQGIGSRNSSVGVQRLSSLGFDLEDGPPVTKSWEFHIATRKKSLSETTWLVDTCGFLHDEPWKSHNKKKFLWRNTYVMGTS